MKTIAVLLAAILTLSTTAKAVTGKIGEYTYLYSGTPVDAPVTSINPPPGSVVIDIVTGTHYRKVSAIDSNATYAVEGVQAVVASTPLTGGTITGSTSQNDEYNYITPAGTIAALTYAFPSNANSRLGQEITLHSTQIVTTLTLSKGGQTITNPVGTALAANVPQRWIKTAASTWTRLSNVATDSGVVLTASVITDGFTASGSASNDFSASTGAFKTSTGVNTFGGSSHLFAAKATPSTDDGAALGDTTHNWSDLFLASGAVLNYANGNVAVTHSSGILTMGTGELRITTPGTNAASVPSLTSTSTLTNKTLTSPVISTGMTASGSAANTFAGSTGTFLTSTGVNTLGGLTVFKSIATPVAAAGSTVSDAAALGAANVIYVSSDSAAKGVKFATSTAGEIRWVVNTSATACKIYAASGGTTNGGAPDASVTIPASKGVLCFSTSADTWIIFDLPAKSS